MAVDSIGGTPGGREGGGAKVIDSDVDVHDPRQAGETRPRAWDLILAIAAGGALGAEGRYGVGLLLPRQPGQFPWATVLTNVVGCLLIGALMVVLLELTEPHRLARPFLAVGLLGGFTTFSTFAMDTEQLILEHRVVMALTNVVVTAVVCASAVWTATVFTRVISGRLSRRSARRRRKGIYR